MTLAGQFFGQGFCVEYAELEPFVALKDSGGNVTQWLGQADKLLKQTKKLSAGLYRINNKVYFIKCFTNATAKVKRICRNHVEIANMGIPVAKLYGCVFDKENHYAYVVYEALQGMIDLRHFSEAASFDDWFASSSLLDHLANDLAVLHSHSFCHGDMKWANIMVNAETYDYKLIDLDGTKKPILFKARFFAKDLARFILNAREKRVAAQELDGFLTAYARCRKLELAGLKLRVENLYRQLLARHERKYGVKV